MAIINPWIFYLIDVLSSLKGISLTVIVITLFGSIGLGTYITFVKSCYWYDEEDRHLIAQLTKILKKVLIVLCIVAGVYTVTPSEETMYKMLVAQNVTYENVDKATEAIKDGVDYIFKKLGKEDKKK
jgi:formate hydrogenlyase subunit 3/multisubunit Na+/H+ antiporter MnhD subunit